MTSRNGSKILIPAQFTKPSAWVIERIKYRSSLEFEMSSKWVSQPVLIFKDSKSDRVLEMAITFAPSSDSITQVARPIPLPAPVTIMVFPISSLGI